ncbi:MAG: ABC transporter permease [Nitrospinota bacterium]
MLGRENPRGIVSKLALADLRHEWILTFCLVMAIAAVIAPLLILMGLKYGIIATLRERFIQDPRYREIRPAATKVHPESWFRQVQTRPSVAFLVPTILPAASVVQVLRPGSGKPVLIDLIPTAQDDPLILENGGRIPGPNQSVFTWAAAKDLGVRVGDRVVARVARIRRGRREYGTASLEVASVLRPSAGSLERMYAPLSFVLDVESYKEGMAIPERGWDGGTPRPYLSFDGIIAVLPKALTPIQTSGLAIGTGLTVIERLDREGFRRLTGFAFPNHLFAYDLKVTQGAVRLSSYRVLKKNKLRGRGAILLPYVKPTEIRLSGETEKSVLVAGLSLSALKAKRLGLPTLPWGALRPDACCQEIRQILLPPGLNETERLVATVKGSSGSVSFPLQNRGASFADYALAPVELLGMIRTGRQRAVLFNEKTRSFVLARIGFRGFRLYARSIDDVAPLSRDLEREGIDVIAHADEIERIRILDRGLTRIFWLVAVVGILGGIAALIASLYAAVERKKRDLGVMRLIGLTRSDLFRFPVYQGVVFAGLGIAVAFLGYFGLAAVINRVFAGDLEFGEKICDLPNSYLVIAFTGTVATAILSSLFAAWKTTQIEPAEAMRDE